MPNIHSLESRNTSVEALTRALLIQMLMAFTQNHKTSRLGKTTASQHAEPGTSESAAQEETENVPKLPAQN